VQWNALVEVEKYTKTAIIAKCPVCHHSTFHITEGIGSCSSCGFYGTKETVYRLLTGACRETAQEEVAFGTKPKIGQQRLL